MWLYVSNNDTLYNLDNVKSLKVTSTFTSVTPVVNYNLVLTFVDGTKADIHLYAYEYSNTEDVQKHTKELQHRVLDAIISANAHTGVATIIIDEHFVKKPRDSAFTT